MDLTWSDATIFACPCGTLFPVKRWRWVDAVARPELVEAVTRDGPYEGPCPDCGRLARAAGTWLHLDGLAETATLMISAQRRGAVTAELREHVSALEARVEAVQSWLVQPRLRFVDLPDLERIGRRTTSASASGELIIGGPPPPPRGIDPRPATRVPTGPIGVGVPQLIGAESMGPRPEVKLPSLGAAVADLEIVDGEVRLLPSLDLSEQRNWSTAGLKARPVLLRRYGYPLLGVRVVGAFMGQVGCIDGLVDPAGPLAEEIHELLGQSFEVVIDLGVDADGEPVLRKVSRPGLEPNAQLCYSSAQGLLPRSGHRGADFDTARERLGDEAVGERLHSRIESVAEGAYPHIVGAAEAAAALEHLDRISRREHLAALLEEQGFPVGEYDALRRRVLAGSLAHGMVAPRRFWRRVVASGLAVDLQDYAERLAENRAEWEGEEEDLSPERVREAWQGILDLCQRKGLSAPEALVEALDRYRRESEEVDGPAPIPIDAPGMTDLRRRLGNPAHRLRLAGDILQGRVNGPPDLVFEVLEEFEVDELLAVLPDLSDLGSRAVPGLIAKLEAPREEIRQASAILLGLALDPAALEPLIDRLLVEDAEAWLDIARAVGSFGASAVPGLCAALQREGHTEDARTLERVARALAEIALSDGQNWPDTTSASHQAVVGLGESDDSRVVAASRRALATLRDVSEFGAIMRGELPPPEHSTLRRFARRAYEAIMIPELEVEVEA